MKNILKYAALLSATIICLLNNRQNVTGTDRLQHLNLQLVEALLILLFLGCFIWVTITHYKNESQGLKLFLIIGMATTLLFLVPSVKYEYLFIPRIIIYSFTCCFLLGLDLVLLLKKIPTQKLGAT